MTVSGLWTLCGKAADIRRDDELRFEAIATVARPGLRPLGVVNADGVDSWVYFRSAPRVNADGTLVALNMRQGEESRIDVFEIPSGKLVRKKIARSGLYKVVDFRPGTTQLALLWVDTAAEEVGGGRMLATCKSAYGTTARTRTSAILANPASNRPCLTRTGADC